MTILRHGPLHANNAHRPARPNSTKKAQCSISAWPALARKLQWRRLCNLSVSTKRAVCPSSDFLRPLSVALFHPPPKNMGGYPIRKAALIPPSSASVTIQPSSTSVTIPSSSASETTPLSSASTTTRTIPKDLYGFHFDRFVEDKSNFLPQNGHRTIEIEESADGSKLSLTEKEISESEISSWLHQVSITFLD